MTDLKTMAAECRAASENKALSIGEAWELLARVGDYLDTLRAEIARLQQRLGECEGALGTDQRAIADNAALRAEIEHLTKHIARAESAAEQWRPIETAPKTGEVLTFSPARRDFNRRIVVNYRDLGEWQRSLQGNPPTHWMPLPPPPEGDAS